MDIKVNSQNAPFEIDKVLKMQKDKDVMNCLNKGYAFALLGNVEFPELVVCVIQGVFTIHCSKTNKSFYIEGSKNNGLIDFK